MTDIIQEAIVMTPSTHPRLTYSLNMYHQVPGEDARQMRAANSGIFLNLMENPWERTISVNKIPVKLEYGWLKEDQLSAIVLINITGRGRQVKPTAEEKLHDESAIVKVEPYTGVIVVPGGLPTIITLDSSFRGISLRTENDSVARIQYFGIPK
jgi:hypothetical protein